MAGAIFGQPKGMEGVNKVTLPDFTHNQVTEVVRRHDSPEKLAGGLLFMS